MRSSSDSAGSLPPLRLDASGAEDDAERDALDPEIVAIEGVEVAPFSSIVRRLRSEYPQVAATRIETILLREWEAFTAGRPLVVPVAVEDGVREILDQR